MASLFFRIGFAGQICQSSSERVRFCVTVCFYGFVFSEVFSSVLEIPANKSGWLLGMLGFGWSSPGVFPSSLSSVSPLVACRRHRCLLLLHVFFNDLTMLPHPPPPEGFSPQIVWLFVRVSFFSFVPALLALREKEQANRAHHTLDVYVIVMCSGSVFVKRRCSFDMWYLAAFGSNSQRFSGELLVPLFRCCC